MEDELKRFIQVWLSAIVSVCYCYYIPPRIKAGAPRFFSILPVCVQFFVFPWLFSSSVYIVFIMVFLTLMGSPKLILFAFDKGPLFPLPSNLLHFICFTCFPIEKLQQNPKSLSSPTKWVFAVKLALLGVLLHVRGYNQNLPQVLLWALQPLYMYLPLDIVLTVIKFLLTIILGCELKPVFDEPYLATSLQDFWGRRWNPMVSSILSSLIYAPIQGMFNGNSSLAKFVGVLTTFLASGLFHVRASILMHIWRTAFRGGHFVLCVTWGLYCGGSDGEEVNVWKAMGGETSGVLVSHHFFYSCDQCLALFPSSYKGKDTSVSFVCK